MALRDTMLEKARPHLQPGEQVQAVFGGQKISQWWLLLSVLILVFANKYRVVVVTDRRILVLAGTTWSQSKVTGVLAEVPRSVQVGPPSGLWWRCTSLGEPLHVHRRFHKDVVAADVQRPAHPSGPPPAFPPPAFPPPGR
ncbi:hypothetical protein FE634_17050 [Nocardioides dongxiaopingii]|uniref:hypothetical protein n=1 Tax=Nocardioides sp. S-1144 TaxID=2582905 RepID=UPI00110F42FC|nr:hypothetical protein [Nocardioides sp. S-1144]QCW51690.1 hypothetical protein FE634_17050 [Nocardioides sp. S-1144]